MTERTDPDLDELADRFRDLVDVRDRRYHLQTYEQCFVGSEACDRLVEAGLADDRGQAERLGDRLLEAGLFHHVTRDHPFRDDHLFYRFADDEDHGRRTRLEADDEERPLSWADLRDAADSLQGADNLRQRLPDQIELRPAEALDRIGLEPMDEQNVELLDRVGPPGWVNPDPEPRYNLVVVGAGTGGLVAAAAAAGLGAKVALVEKHLMGGDCLNFGCVPSKTLLRSAKAAAEVRDAERFGIRVDGEVQVDFERVMERVRSVRAHISPHDSAERFARELGVDVFLGHGEFVGPNSLEVDDTRLAFAKACIATGARPATPPIPGLDETSHLTSRELFNLTDRPDRLGIVGAGPIGAEMAQAFARLGSEVVVFNQRDRILGAEEPDAARIVRRALADDGVDFRLGADIERVSGPDDADDDGPVHLALADGTEVECDRLLVAAGRRPNVDGLGLEAAGVEFDSTTGIEVDDRLRTTNADVYAVGDVATRYQFTHAADVMARMVVRNALFFGRRSFDDLVIPWCTYTDPGLAHVGPYPRELDERGIDYETFEQPMAEVDRALVEGATDGFVRLHADPSGAILGATIVAPHAGDLIAEIVVAMRADMTLDSLADVIHPYPTTAGAIRATGDAYNRTRLTPTVEKLFRRLLQMRR